MGALIIAAQIFGGWLAASIIAGPFIGRALSVRFDRYFANIDQWDR